MALGRLNKLPRRYYNHFRVRTVAISSYKLALFVLYYLLYSALTNLLCTNTKNLCMKIFKYEINVHVNDFSWVPYENGIILRVRHTINTVHTLVTSDFTLY